MKFMRQLMIIMLVSFIAELMEYFIPLPIAASVYGLVLMLLALITKVIPLEKVEGAANFLVSLMPIVFIPINVGIFFCPEEMYQMMVPLIVITLSTTLLIMGVTGRVAQFMIRRGDRSKKEELPEKEEGGGEE